MKIGIFDSGLGGLIVAKAIKKLMPEYDYVYLGDTKRVPYGPRSHDTIFEFTKQGVEYLFEKENCILIIIACNTSSARALRRIQQEYLPKHWPDRNVIGVLIPTAEACANYKKVGIIGTLGTISSNTFPIEIKKLNKMTKVFQNPAPMLVPLAEEGEKVLAKPFLEKYLKPFIKNPRGKASGEIEALALGCTHYPFYKKEIKKIVGPKVKVLSQDEIVPAKLKEYIKRHPEISKQLSKNKTTKILLTDLTKHIQKLSKSWFGPKAKPELIKL
ncbi:MAG: glutamate racemase [Candidatus Paceibacterota bacterium]|jgi:glutamate racemase